MKRVGSILLSGAGFIVAGLIVLQCGSVNKLKGYDFYDRTAAARMALPPRAEVFTDEYVDVQGDNPIEAIIRAGTTVAKEIEAHKVQGRLDSVMLVVDIPEIIRERTLQQCGKYLQYRPVDDTKSADYIFDMDIKKYGIDAKSWNADVHFKLDIEIKIIDNKKDMLIWKRTFREKQAVTSATFDLHESAGDVITAVALSKLSVEELESGFEYLSSYVADRVAKKLYDQYLETIE